MSFKTKNKFPIPKEELAYVAPEVRTKLFRHLLNTYKECVPDLKLMVAYLNWGYDEDERIKIKGEGALKLPQPRIIFNKKEDINNPEFNSSLKDILNDAWKQQRKCLENKNTGPLYDQPCAIDYLLIFKFNIQNRVSIFIDCPYICTRNSIPGYRYALRTEQLEFWLECVLETMTRISEHKFYEYITCICGLSIDKQSRDYWKKPENIKFLIPKLIDLRLRHMDRNTY